MPATASDEADSADSHSVPTSGTNHLVNLDRARSSKRDGSSAIILIPTPSSDPNDPLNWSPRRKALATFCWAVYVFANGITASNLPSILVVFSQASSLPVSTLNAGTGYLFLLAGWSLLFWQPFALQYGKRPTYILTLLGMLGMSVWAPFIRSPGTWYARSILIGFFAAPIEALPALSIADMHFAHQRGTYLGLYAFCLVGSNFVSPFIFGFVSDRQGWPWVFYWPAIFCGGAALFLLFCLEETNYTETNLTETTSTQPPRKRRPAPLYFFTPSPSPPSQIPTRLLTQLRFLTWPIPIYAGFAYGSTLIWFNVLNATASSILSAPPYAFAPTIVGTAYLSPLLGTALGMLVAGRASDALVLALAARRGGIMQPEMRLYVYGATTLLIPAALVLWGVGAAHQIHWFGLVVAMALLAFNNTVGASLAVNYLVDCYRELAGTALTAVICVRNTMSFAIGYGITPWIAAQGLQDAFVTAAFVGMGISLGWVGMVWLGEGCRVRSARAYWRLVERERAMH